MKFDPTELCRRAEHFLRSGLEQIPFLKITDFEKQSWIGKEIFDFSLQVETPYFQKKIIANVSSNGQPRIVRRSIDRLMRCLEFEPHSALMLIAPYISTESAKICESENISYMDLAGNCLLKFGGIFVRQQGNPNIFSENRFLRSLYSPKASRILRVLLSKPRKTWTVKELSQEAKTSVGQVSNVRGLLLDEEWIEKENNGITLIKPESLFDGWKAFYNYRRNTSIDCFTLQNLPEFERLAAKKLKDQKIPYAFTGFTAAAKMAPIVRYNRIMLFVSEEYWKKALPLLELKEVDSGANITILSPYDDGVFYGMKERDRLQVVSPIQAYLDLWSYKGRGEEASYEILEKEIKPLWSAEKTIKVKR